MPLTLEPGDMVMLDDNQIVIITKVQDIAGTTVYDWTIPVEHGSSPTHLVKFKVTHFDDWERLVGMK